jgi:hypothetical protein
VSVLADALLAELDEAALERLAQLLAPRMVGPNTVAPDGWLRGAGRIAEYIDAPRSRVYALTSAGRIPIEHDGSNLIARRSELDAWIRSGGGKRP